jgi:hypothetical protein
MVGATKKMATITGTIAAFVTIAATVFGVYTKAALADTNERVGKLEAQRDAIEESLKRIEGNQSKQTERLDRVLERLSDR